MQTYSNIIDPEISINTLPLLSTKLTLPAVKSSSARFKAESSIPDGWIYTNIRLNQNTFLTNTSSGLATLVTDNFNNSYQYISQDQAPFLYQNFI